MSNSMTKTKTDINTKSVSDYCRKQNLRTHHHRGGLESSKTLNAAQRPITIEEASLYTSTRRPPPGAILPEPLNPERPKVNALRQSNRIISRPANTLPAPVFPPHISEKQLRALPATQIQTIANQQCYAIAFNCLERGGGWLWWEADYVDTEAVNRDFGKFSGLSVTNDLRGIVQIKPTTTNHQAQVVHLEDKVGQIKEKTGAQSIAAMLGEVEEEVPEWERVRTENNIRIAAYITKVVMSDRID